jgi:hypothetical protein
VAEGRQANRSEANTGYTTWVTSAGSGVTTFAAGTHNTGQGEVLITRSISDPKT